MAILVVVCLVNWWLLIPTGIVAVLLFLLRDLFLHTSRELKRIEAIGEFWGLISRLDFVALERKGTAWVFSQ